MTGHKDVVRDKDLLWGSLAGVGLDADDRLRATEDRKKNPLRHVDHLGLGCRDAETTRHFYEDILGMPLVMAIVLPDPSRNNNQEYCHLFFEIDSGTRALWRHAAQSRVAHIAGSVIRYANYLRRQCHINRGSSAEFP
ncbi:VOC family protein [Paraburkholderia humisilvae]|uniref:VOC domain-containing protein n=1 Tax=Paraburkholderia humisilvae TaxID=627669 RepID=A0A6J5DQE2_9BURK|nr:VOC family protein [Paraburkholderia humisilvae]CAB3756510.1 hypothetical protein LMG29542_02884 [Paraburkholderia humisilvae]